MSPRDRAREEAFETTGLIRVSVTDLEVYAADIQDLEVDRLVEALRLATIRLGDRLALIKHSGLRSL